jgi:hypothetical protein
MIIPRRQLWEYAPLSETYVKLIAAFYQFYTSFGQWGVFSLTALAVKVRSMSLRTNTSTNIAILAFLWNKARRLSVSAPQAAGKLIGEDGVNEAWTGKGRLVSLPHTN